MKTALKYIIRLLPWMFGLSVFLFFYVIYKYHLHYQEQLQLFLYTTGYFSDLVSIPGGFSDYAGRFLTQFFIYSWSGALIIALLLVALQQLMQYIASRFSDTVSWMPLTYLPSLMYWYMLCDESFMLGGLLALVITLAAVSCGLSLKSLKVQGIYFLMMIPVVYWLAGGAACVFALILLEDHWLNRKKVQKSRLLFLVITGLLLVVACPLIAKSFLVQYPLSRLWWGVTYYRFPLVGFPLILVIWAFVVIIPFIFKYIPDKKTDLCKFVLTSGMIVLIALIAGYFLKESYLYNAGKEEIMGYDYHCRMQQWDAVIRMADKKSPDTPMSVTCLNLALSKKGQLPEKMFRYFQNGSEGLLPTFKRDFTLPLIAGEPYYYLGFINTAQRYAFESMEALPDYQKSVRCIKRLAETNLINGQYEVARKYLLILKKTLFYKKWAEETMTFLYDEAKIASHPEWGSLRHFRTQEDFLFSDQEKDMMLGVLFQQHRDHRMAFEYLLAYSLLTKDLQHFLDYFRLAKDFDYQPIPRSYQEALIYIWGLTNKDITKDIPFPVSDAVKQRVQAYGTVYTSQQHPEPLLRKQFSNTYWYYFHFTNYQDATIYKPNQY